MSTKPFKSISLAFLLFFSSFLHGEVPFGFGFLISYAANTVNPIDVAIGQGGNILLLDSTQANVQVFEPNGFFLFTLNGVGGGGTMLKNPQGIASDKSGNIYVTDSTLKNVQVFSSNSSFLFAFNGLIGGGAQFVTPRGIAVDAAGNIYVVDSSLRNVQVFNSDGSFLFVFDGTKGGGSQFKAPIGITSDQLGNIYVTDTSLHTVQVFDSAGSFLFSFDGTKGGGYQFISPVGVALDEKGNIYVSDNRLFDIQAFNSTGSFLFHFNSTLGGGPLKIPQGIAVNSIGNIYAAFTHNYSPDEVQAFGFYLPSLNLTGTCKKSTFSDETELCNVVQWSSKVNNGLDPSSLVYKLLRDGELLTTVVGKQSYSFEDHDLISGKTYTYLLTVTVEDNLIGQRSVSVRCK